MKTKLLIILAPMLFGICAFYVIKTVKQNTCEKTADSLIRTLTPEFVADLEFKGIYSQVIKEYCKQTL